MRILVGFLTLSIGMGADPKTYAPPMSDFVPHPYMSLEGIRSLDCESCKRIASQVRSFAQAHKTRSSTLITFLDFPFHSRTQALKSLPEQLHANRNVAW